MFLHDAVSVRKVPDLQCLPCHLTFDVSTEQFFPLLNPGWSIQMSGALAVSNGIAAFVTVRGVVGFHMITEN